jgi:hypothetical protein
VNHSEFGGFDPAEIRDVWNQKMQPIADQVISPKVSVATRRFLSEVGLPIDHSMPDVEFVYDDRLSGTVRSNGSEFLVITDTDSPVVLAVEVVSDQVYELDLSDPANNRFFNSSLPALVFFLGLLNKNVLGLADWTEETLPPAVEGVWDELVARDPRAMDGTTPWKAWLDDLGSQYE